MLFSEEGTKRMLEFGKRIGWWKREFKSCMVGEMGEGREMW